MVSMLALVKSIGDDSRQTGALPLLDGHSEAELIHACRRGERSAQDEFYQRFRRSVTANLFRVIGDRSELDDLVQEVFVIAFRGLDKFRGDAKLSTWMYRICVNVALGRLRTKRRKPGGVAVADLDVTAASQQLLDRPETPERAMQRRQAAERVYAALDVLAPKKRIVLYLHEIEGMELKDIAYLVDSNAVTVRTRLYYARREFYRALGGQGPMPGDAPKSPSEKIDHEETKP
jgi:RNA polymerase sigma-70 factor, ECF subfamily